MDDASRRIVSSERLDLIQAYERATTHRDRALAANTLWQSLPAHSRNEICRTQGHHCGVWLHDKLAKSDERSGYSPLTPTARNNLRILLLKERPSSKGRPPRDVRVVWDWLDAGEITPAQLKLMLQRAETLMMVPGADWDDCLLQARAKATGEELGPITVKPPPSGTERPPSIPPASIAPSVDEAPPESVPVPITEAPPPTRTAPSEVKRKAIRASKPSKRPPPAKGKGKPSRAAVEKTLQFQALRKVIDEAPPPRELPLPEGVDAATYREAYSEMLENVRVVLEIAGRDFSNAKRRYRTTEISSKVGSLARACRTLRVAVPAHGQPVDEFNSRRRWLEIVKAYHPDKIGGDDSKVEVFHAANKAFEAIKDYNRSLTQQKSQETR